MKNKLLILLIFTNLLYGFGFYEMDKKSMNDYELSIYNEKYLKINKFDIDKMDIIFFDAISNIDSYINKLNTLEKKKLDNLKFWIKEVNQTVYIKDNTKDKYKMKLHEFELHKYNLYENLNNKSYKKAIEISNFISHTTGVMKEGIINFNHLKDSKHLKEFLHKYQEVIIKQHSNENREVNKLKNQLFDLINQ